MAIQVGQKAPDFTLYDNEKNKVTLSDYRGQKCAAIVLPACFYKRMHTGTVLYARQLE
jgi:glutaredoxin-dependent peroxiredoxin